MIVEKTIWYRGEIWEDIKPTLNEIQDSNWPKYEQMFAEHGHPGFTVVTEFGTGSLVQSDKPVETNFLLYRNEIGELVAMVVFYRVDETDSNGASSRITKAHFGVRPDHQRTGLATQIMVYALENYGEQYDYDVRKQEYTASGAAVVNNYIKNKYANSEVGAK